MRIKKSSPVGFIKGFILKRNKKADKGILGRIESCEAADAVHNGDIRSKLPRMHAAFITQKIILFYCASVLFRRRAEGGDGEEPRQPPQNEKHRWH